MAAKILIINEICNYFMLTLLKDRVIKACFMIKDRVIKACFMIKDRVIKACFMIKDRVIEVQKIPAIGIISYSRDFSIYYSESSIRLFYI